VLGIVPTLALVAGSDGGPATERFRLAISATVKSIDVAREIPQGTIQLDFDARWLVVITVESVDVKDASVDVGSNLAFLIHFPSMRLGMDYRDAIGKTMAFELSGERVGGAARYLDLAIRGAGRRTPGRDRGSAP